MRGFLSLSSRFPFVYVEKCTNGNLDAYETKPRTRRCRTYSTLISTKAFPRPYASSFISSPSTKSRPAFLIVLFHEYDRDRPGGPKLSPATRSIKSDSCHSEKGMGLCWADAGGGGRQADQSWRMRHAYLEEKNCCQVSAIEKMFPA